jgi:galactokinase
VKLFEWLDEVDVKQRLLKANMRSSAADDVAQLFVQAAQGLRDDGVPHWAKIIACWVPGRIEVLGKHTDYCGGRSVLAAAERGFAMVATVRDGQSIRVIDVARHALAEFAASEAAESKPGHWSNYFITVAKRVARNFPTAMLAGAIAFASNLPASAGMSSSSAIIVGSFLLLAELNQISNDAAFRSSITCLEQLAGYLGTVENGSSFGPLTGSSGVGTFGGSEDHTAILCGHPDCLVQYAYSPVRYERTISLSGDFNFAVCSSGVVADKTGSSRDKYNRLSLLAKAVVENWQRETGGTEATIAAILATDHTADAHLEKVLRSVTDGPYSHEELLARVEHYTLENEIIELVPSTLDAATITTFGQLVQRSQQAAEQLLANQTLETNHLVESANRIGARAASTFGAGFGGSVWALLDRSNEADFLRQWRQQYTQAFPLRRQGTVTFTTRPGIPAQMWSDNSQLMARLAMHG